MTGMDARLARLHPAQRLMTMLHTCLDILVDLDDIVHRECRPVVP
jgi:hypothetical protein